jgi:hypothetical protein
MPQLPSLQLVLAEAGCFPLTLLCAVVVFVAGYQGVTYLYSEANQPAWVFPLLSAGLLGLAAERYRWPAAGRWLALGGALVGLAGWYALAPPLPGLGWGTRLAVLLGLHLAVAAAPYLGELRRGADTPGFWHYNETLLLRLLTAGLYSGVLYAGGALALVAVRELFDWHTDSDVFGYLFVGLGTLFNTWFFLAGVPADFAALEREAPYPKGLKVFTQFVLLPLAGLYVGILYAYLGRIMVHGQLPEGWVAVLILALAVVGILALLLIHPLRHNPGNTWIRTFARWFYWALLPLRGLLAVAIGPRIRAYGLTEERYFVLLLAAWLLGMVGYFLWRQGQGIVWVPASLAVLALGSVAGPWGAFAVAERSQLGQLRALTNRYQLLQNGHLYGASARAPGLPRAVRGRLASLFYFFAERNALARLQPQFAGSLALPDSVREQSAYVQRQWRKDRPVELSGFEYLESYELQQAFNDTPGQQSTYYSVRDMPSYYALGQGQYWVKDVSSLYSKADSLGRQVLALPLREGSFRLGLPRAGDSLLLQQRPAAGPWQTQLAVVLRPLADSLYRHYGQHAKDLDLPAPVELPARAGHLQLHLFASSLNRHEFDHRMQYFFAAEGLLQITP